MPRLDVSGASLYYETMGDPHSPALLLIHAGIATLRMWDAQVSALALRHYVIRFDTRGFGQTTTENVEFSNRADARALLDHLGVARATLIGCSRGGTIAIDLAVESPERVAGLVTIGSGLSGFADVELTASEDALFDKMDAAFAARQWPRLARLEVALWAVGPTRKAAEVDPDFLALAQELNLRNVIHATEAPISLPLEPPALDRLCDIDIPVLVTVGELDVSASLVHYEFLLEMLPKASGCTFRGAAHLPSVEHPLEFQRVLVSWLATNDL